MRSILTSLLTLGGLMGAASAQDLVDLHMISTGCTITGDVAHVDLFAVSNGASTPMMGAIDAILIWDPAVLELMGEDSSGSPISWLATGFLPEPDGINTTFADGDALFTALATPGFPAPATPPPGTLVTTLLFRVLMPTAGATVSFAPTLGMFGRTRVLDCCTPNLEITGDISDVDLVVSCPNLGTSYCGNTPNSTGDPASISGTGSAVVSMNDFTLSTHQLPANQFGYYLASDGMGLIDLPAAGLSQGFFCLAVGPNLGRYNGQILDSGPTGFFALQLDLTAVPIASAPGSTALMPGDTWYFQSWYRDVGNTNNFSDAICVTFQ